MTVALLMHYTRLSKIKFGKLKKCKVKGEVQNITRIQICLKTHGRNHFFGKVVTTENTRKNGDEQEEKTCLLYLVLQKCRNISGNAVDIVASIVAASRGSSRKCRFREH